MSNESKLVTDLIMRKDVKPISIVRSEDLEVTEVLINGEMTPPDPLVIHCPTDLQPFWRFSYSGYDIYATGSVTVKTKIMEKPREI